MALERIRAISIAGRIFLSIVFIYSAVIKFRPKELHGYIDTLQEKGVPPQHVTTLAMLALSTELVGGLMLLLGIFPRFGATLLVVFLVWSSLVLHRFWIITDLAVQAQELSHFMKNVALLGSLLCFIAVRDRPKDNGPKKKTS
mmetsp:Transcript_24900/g.41003  ORF Transcript_24900/g.41003 Transcript_24900/m.41003 type:complete len:143 (+) Transcript_24900:73-501(+)